MNKLTRADVAAYFQNYHGQAIYLPGSSKQVTGAEVAAYVGDLEDKLITLATAVADKVKKGE